MLLRKSAAWVNPSDDEDFRSFGNSLYKVRKNSNFRKFWTDFFNPVPKIWEYHLNSHILGIGWAILFPFLRSQKSFLTMANLLADIMTDPMTLSIPTPSKSGKISGIHFSGQKVRKWWKFAGKAKKNWPGYPLLEGVCRPYDLPYGWHYPKTTCMADFTTDPMTPYPKIVI